MGVGLALAAKEQGVITAPDGKRADGSTEAVMILGKFRRKWEAFGRDVYRHQ